MKYDLYILEAWYEKHGWLPQIHLHTTTFYAKALCNLKRQKERVPNYDYRIVRCVPQLDGREIK